MTPAPCVVSAETHDSVPPILFVHVESVHALHDHALDDTLDGRET